ncbi:enoyl-CoA hydratase/isomerase family protein [Aneurinibacillus terranovensis]|uniref:enoyl-CoA hydratase/isomerase family protein n=1 Tax=Aneurinibacillus terranovensis TaxID=278991 RepID=UPI0003FD3195|nr:enoyl-CoA hydratase-related protein [Aneurinibacillus terranovensis]
MNFENILVYKDGAIGVIKINRPEVRNALDARTLLEIEQALDQWERHEEVKVIVLTGEGDKSFAAGADIKQLREKTAVDALFPGLSGLCRKIENASKVTVAAINGYALGGGCEVALACDIRVATEEAKFGLPELNLSIIPGAGGTQRLARIIGKGRAMDMILTGEIISAKKAEEFGLVSKVVSREELWETVLEKTSKILAKGPLAIRLAKQVVHRGFDADMDTALILEKLAQSILFSSEDKQEGITAFLEKRSPRYQGR